MNFMNKKLNKKGFTLIEMLVVIAIIAILVAIVIPVVGKSTLKAKAATNAANLRSAQAEYVTSMLSTGESTGKITSDYKFYAFAAADVNGAANFDEDATTGVATNSDGTCTWQGLNAAQWGEIAGGSDANGNTIAGQS